MFDAIVIGGGFFGLYVAEHLAEGGQEVLLCERGPELMGRASYHNQARVHNGYHYPRSLLTALRSHVNYPRFLAEFGDCTDATFTKLYAVGRRGSKVSANQFYRFVRQVGSAIERAPRELAGLFDPIAIEDVFLVDECAFDATALRRRMAERVVDRGVEIRTRTRVARFRPAPGGAIDAELEGEGGTGGVVRASRIFNCAYAHINEPIRGSGLEPVPLKHELAEMCLVRVPEPLRGVGVTVMCGPFFSCMPFPPRGLHTLSHVRYTPHFGWFDREPGDPEPYDVLAGTPRVSAFPYMVRDAARMLPALADCRLEDSLWEVKTVLPRSEADDGRPILFKADYGMANHHVIMGGKLDNVYDIVQAIDRLGIARGRVPCRS